ncbi:MAG: tyrosine-type recombinase/integrase [Terracidiphilus sp.]
MDLLSKEILKDVNLDEAGPKQTAWQTLKDWRSQFPNALPEHYVFPRESYGLKATKGQKGKGGVQVPLKTFPDIPVGSFATAWRRAKKAARVECRWHDLRHTFCSRLSDGGVADVTVQAMAGWMSKKMQERYSHANNEAKRAAVAVFDTLSSVQ